MCFVCEFCGFKSTEIKSGGAISEMGQRITLKVMSESDLKRDLLKSTTASLRIPEVDLEVTAGTLGGTFTTVEGMIMQVVEQLNTTPQCNFCGGDSGAVDTNLTPMQRFVDRLKALLELKAPFTLILDDPLANIYIQNSRAHLKPPDNADPQLTTENYERSWEQDEDLGIHQMSVD